MAWLDTLLDHFAHYPTHLFALLVVMALSKSTVLISSVLPPASVMLLAGIAVSQSSMHPALTWLAVVMGAELPYRPADGAYPASVTLHGKTCREVFAGTAPAA